MWGTRRHATALPITDRESLIRLVTVLYKSPWYPPGTRLHSEAAERAGGRAELALSLRRARIPTEAGRGPHGDPNRQSKGHPSSRPQWGH